MHQRPPQRPQSRPTPQTKPRRSGIWNFLAVLTLILAASYAWPSILTAIKAGAFEGAKAGAEAGAKAAVEEAIKKMNPWE